MQVEAIKLVEIGNERGDEQKDISFAKESKAGGSSTQLL